MTRQLLVAEFLRTQAYWRLGRAGDAPVRAARCAAALLDAAAFVATLAADDEILVALARAGCFRGSTFDPGDQGRQVARWWQFGELPHEGPRNLLRALVHAAGQPAAQPGPAS